MQVLCRMRQEAVPRGGFKELCQMYDVKSQISKVIIDLVYINDKNYFLRFYH